MIQYMQKKKRIIFFVALASSEMTILTGSTKEFFPDIMSKHQYNVQWSILWQLFYNEIGNKKHIFSWLKIKDFYIQLSPPK